MAKEKSDGGIHLPGGPVVFREDLIFDGNPFPKSAFISHTSSDEPFYEKNLAPIFKTCEIHCFFLNYKIAARTPVIAEAYKKLIIQEIQHLHWFILILSKKSIASKWVKFEVECALKFKNKSQILVIQCEDCEPTDLHTNLREIRLLNFLNDSTLSETDLVNIFTSSKK